MMLGRRGFLAGSLAGGLAAAGGRALARGDEGRKKGSPDLDLTISDPAALQEKLRAEARRVMAATRVDSEFGTFHMPSASTYPGFFAWDSGWNAIALSVLDPELAYQELKTVFAAQMEDGRIPHEVEPEGAKEKELARKAVKYLVRRQFDAKMRSAFIDPPSFLLAAEVLYERTHDPRVLEFLPAMQKCVDYLTGPRDLRGDGLCSIIHPWESGTDAAPVFDAPLHTRPQNPLFLLDYAVAYPRLLNRCADLHWDLPRIAEQNGFVFEDVGMNALTAAGLLSMSNLYAAAADLTYQTGVSSTSEAESEGLQAQANHCRQRAEAMIKAMEKFFWDESAGFFFPRYDLKAPQLSKRTCLTGLLPLLTGLVSADKARRVIQDHLLSPAHFYSPLLVPFNSISELAKENIPAEDQLIWRGHCIWINMNWMAARAAAKNGNLGLAREITRKTAALIGHSGFREFYDPRTGEGKGAAGFTWPALVLEMIESFGL